MIIKKFIDKDSRRVMAKIRKEFGPEAIILSSKEVGDQFEMVATPNYDEQDIEQEIAMQHQLKREQDIKAELSSLYAKDQQSLKILQDEMIQMRAMIEAQLQRDKLLFDSLSQIKTKQNQNSVEGLQTESDSVSSAQTGSDPSLQKHLDQHLAGIGLSRRLRDSLRRRLQGIEEPETASSKTVQILSAALKEMPQTGLPKSGIAAFVGAPGTGKTTALIKLAQKHRKQHGVADMGLILLNQQHLRGKQETNLLVKYADTVGINYVYADSSRQLLSAVKKLAKKKLLLIDTSASQGALPALEKAFAALRKKRPDLLTLLTVPASSVRTEQEEAIKQYGHLASAIVVSKTEKARHLGALVELLIRKKIPLGYSTSNAKLDANIRRESSEQLIRMALDLGRLPNSTEPASQRQQLANSFANVTRNMSANIMGLAS